LEEKRSFLDQVIAAESAAENTLKAWCSGFPQKYLSS